MRCRNEYPVTVTVTVTVTVAVTMTLTVSVETTEGTDKPRIRNFRARICSGLVETYRMIMGSSD
jgi:hypothetical protein